MRWQQWLASAAVEMGTAAPGRSDRADAGGLPLPAPGTSKWNKVEHRLFSFISSNWRGEPLRDYETVVELIASTTTAKGLTVTCRLDRRQYPVGRKVSDEQLVQVHLKPDKFHSGWNYTIIPARKPSCIFIYLPRLNAIARPARTRNSSFADLQCQSLSLSDSRQARRKRSVFSTEDPGRPPSRNCPESRLGGSEVHAF